MILLALVALFSSADAGVEPLVDAQAMVPGLEVELRYATPENFLHRAVYPPGARCLLLPSTAAALSRAAKDVKTKGFRLKAYDCYRPISVQREMWKLFPHRGYVANPEKGSNHNRGAAVDLTLIKLDGSPVEMPSAFDFFGEAAHQSYEGGSEEARRNRETLRAAMEAAGFVKNRMEWWHYDLPHAAQYPLRDDPPTLRR